MRVLHINANYLTSALHQTMMEHFDDSAEHTVFAPTYDETRRIIEPNDNVIVSKCFNKWDRLLFFHKQSKIIKAVEERVDVERQDCIHAYTLFTDGNVAFHLSNKYKKPYVVAVRNTDVNVFFKHMVHLRARGVQILKNASAVFFLSPAYQKCVIEGYVPQALRSEIFKKSAVIPNGIDDFWLKNLYEKDTTEVENRLRTDRLLKCIYVGGIDANKNVELTLRALSELSTEGWKANLSCIGKIQDQRVFDRLTKYDCFSYMSPQKKEELIKNYRKADVFIMPSHKETFGLVYAEAMSQGLPVIYSRGQGFDGQFDDGIVGFGVNSDDPEELGSKLKEIIKNYSSISHNCTDNAKRFNWDSIVEKYTTLYERIAGR